MDNGLILYRDFDQSFNQCKLLLTIKHYYDENKINIYNYDDRNSIYKL